MKNHDTQNDNSIPLSIIISNDDNSNNSLNSSLNNSINNEDYNSLLSKNNNNDSDNNLQDININNNTFNNSNCDNSNSSNNNSRNNKNKVPTFAYIILAIALLAMSSSGTALKTINVPPLLKASWRLQSTSVLLFFGFVYEIILIYDLHVKFIQKIPPSIINKLPQFIIDRLNKLNNFNKLNSDNNNKINDNCNNIHQQLEEQEEIDINQQNNNNGNNSNNNTCNNNDESFNKEEIKLKLFEKKTIILLLSTGFILCLHFAFWVSSLDQTTLSHSLLFVTSSPLMVVIVMFVRRIPISKGEVIGCVLGFIGLIVTLFDSLFLNKSNNDDNSSSLINNSNSDGTTTKGQTPTFYGDMLALLGAVCVVFYLFAGSHLRKWMPIFCYAFIVTFTASIFLSLGSLIFEDRQGNGLVGWFSSSFILITLYIAFGPGFLGHTGMNYVVKFIEPVVISVTLLLEPPIGTIMGYIIGVAGELPSLYTYLGGVLILGGCGICTISSHLKNKK